MLLGSIEAGANKFICAVGDDNYNIKSIRSFTTKTPENTIKEVIDYFSKYNIKALGIASFGPLDINNESQTYGFIKNTPRVDWRDIDLLGLLKQAFNIPISLTTNVNGSAYGEFIISRLSNQPVYTLLYFTVDTGIGAGAVINGRFLGSLEHPEMGHTLVRRHPLDNNFQGICPYHKDCLEGLASEPAFKSRLKIASESANQKELSYMFEAYYIAQGLSQITLLLRPDRIILGGHLMTDKLRTSIQIKYLELINNYIEIPDISSFITKPTLSNEGAGIVGNFALSIKSYHQKN
ncbi:MAG: ROK family protein [Enterococcus sp.]